MSKKIKITVLVSILFSTLIASSNVPQKSKAELILGSWIPTGCPTCKWVFDNAGKCHDYFEDGIETSYNYSIIQEKSINGKLTHSILILVNDSNSKDVYEYEINALGENKMALEYLGGSRSGLLYFEREK